ncbi:MAG TPA: glycosyltransferase family 2 protein [Chitinophagaceae bacterium]|jgi:glycosyltransferase involved in cell wall biosynthesis
MISVVILTKDEKLDLPACLKSLSWCDDVHVLDSGSTDGTIDIALDCGVRVWSNPFESFGKQRNFALDNLYILHEWILFLDADELVTEKFHYAITKATETATDNIAGFYCCSKLMYEGKWLKYSDNFPKWQFRLMRRGRARFTDFGHGQKEDHVLGEIKYVREPYLHNGLSKGWFKWIERHNRYSTSEALVRFYNCPPFKNLFSRHSSIRNPALKSRLTRIPGWPFLRFIHAYFLRFGFLEGPAGFIYCVNNFYYEFMIQIKFWELKKQTKRLEKNRSPEFSKNISKKLPVKNRDLIIPKYFSAERKTEW